MEKPSVSMLIKLMGAIIFLGIFDKYIFHKKIDAEWIILMLISIFIFYFIIYSGKETKGK